MSASQASTECKESPPITVDEFFSSGSPSNLPKIESQLKEFIAHHKDDTSQRVVVITSGGTTVPLEKNTVRFIDNFSTGSRGSASAERFLEAGYAVIFLSRVGSIAPFSRHIQKHVSPRLDLQFMSNIDAAMCDENDKVEFNFKVALDDQKTMFSAIKRYQQVMKNNMLLHVSYETVSEYLFFLRSCCVACSEIGPRAMIYLAAAVSDFFIPDSQLATHKIQSGSGPLNLTLPQTPKMLGTARDKWCNDAMMVSFKLETDDRILLKKAKKAIEKYGMHAVVANQLNTRYEKVVVVFDKEDVLVEKSDVELEKGLIDLLKNRHGDLIDKVVMKT